jgi:hypothetical protein
MTLGPTRRDLRWRIASVIHRAVRRLGSRKSLAEYLGVPVTSVAQWLYAQSDVPDGVWDRIVELLLRL